MSENPLTRVRTRFAPSPTGFLHVGAFRTALFSWLLAKKHGGQFLLRIEDTDRNRLVPGALENLLASLHALGLDYDEGPDAAQVAQLDTAKYGAVDASLLPAYGGDFGPYFQSLRLPRYRELIERLLEEGKAYYAFETKEELDAQRAACELRKVLYLYDRKFRDYPLADARRRVNEGEAHVVRLKMPLSGPIVTHDCLRGEIVFDAATQDDFILLKADGFPPYHFAAIVDDHEMQISHVLRGDDWLPSFPKHVALFTAFGWEPPVFVHTPNVLAPGGGKKLSKRHGAKPILGPVPELRDGVPTGEMTEGLVSDEGYLPEAIVNFLALIGWSPGDNREVMTREELIEAFSLEGISRSGGAFDPEKLLWMNGVYIRKLSRDELARRAAPFLAKAGLVPAGADEGARAYAAEAVALEQEKLARLDDAPKLLDFFFADLPDYQEKSVARWLTGPAMPYLSDLKSALAALADWSSEPIEAAVRAAGARHGREKGEITHPVRVALTGRESGPSLFETMAVLGKERVIRRVAKALEMAGGRADL